MHTTVSAYIRKHYATCFVICAVAWWWIVLSVAGNPLEPSGLWSLTLWTALVTAASAKSALLLAGLGYLLLSDR